MTFLFLSLFSDDIAEAKKIRVVKGAEADAESKYLQGVGVARQRKAIVEGMRDSVLSFSNSVDGTNAKTVMDLVLVTQYVLFLSFVFYYSIISHNLL